MRKLISANFIRLKKSKLFWSCFILMFLFGIFAVLNQYRNHLKYGYDVSLDSVFFTYAIPIGMVIAVFSSIFLGTDYSDGTIRNKLVIGHSRLSIYFVNLLTNIFASFLICLAYLIAVTALGTPLIGFVSVNLKILLQLLFGTFMLLIAFCSVSTFISMICHNKAAGSIISILLIVGLFLWTTSINSKLEAPEYYSGYSIDGQSDEEVVVEEYKNPTYLTGFKRDVYELIYDIVPTGQAVQYTMMSVKYMWRLPLCSLAVAAVTTFAGTFIFRKKDIK